MEHYRLSIEVHSFSKKQETSNFLNSGNHGSALYNKLFSSSGFLSVRERERDSTDPSHPTGLSKLHFLVHSTDFL